MNIIRYYYFLTCLKIKYTAIYRIKFIVAHIICYNIDNVNSFRKYYHDDIPVKYFDILYEQDKYNYIKYILEKKYTTTYLEKYDIKFAVNKYNISDTGYFNDENIKWFYGNITGFEGNNIALNILINTGRFGKFEYMAFFMIHIDIYVFYKLFKHKKFDLIEKYIDKINIKCIKTKKHIRAFIKYISAFIDNKTFVEMYFYYLDMDYFNKYNYVGYLNKSIIMNNIDLAYKFVLKYGVGYIDIKSIIYSYSYDEIINLYENNIIALEDININVVNNDIAILLMNHHIKPKLNTDTKFNIDVIKLYIEKFSIKDLSNMNLYNCIEYLLPLYPIEIIGAGWALEYKLEFCEYIKDVNYSIILPAYPPSINILTHYISQFKKVNIQYNEKKIFILYLKRYSVFSAAFYEIFDIKTLLSDKLVIDELFSNNKNKKIMKYIVKNNLINLKILLTYACVKKSELIGIITKKERFCYSCGLHD